MTETPQSPSESDVEGALLAAMKHAANMAGGAGVASTVLTSAQAARELAEAYRIIRTVP